MQIAMYFCYFHFDMFHFTVAHAYAKLGNPHAQHIVGERLLYGKGVEMDKVWYMVPQLGAIS